MKKFPIIGLIILAACSGPSELNPDPKDIVVDTVVVEEPIQESISEVETTIKEVMKIHDDVMPKRETILAFMQQLEVLKDEDAQASYVYGELENADKAMMAWMHEIEVTKKGTEEERLNYFQSEKIKIENVKTMMLNSIELAKGYLGDEK